MSDAEVERLSRLDRADQTDGTERPTPAADMTLFELSARNRLIGFVEEVRVDGLLAQVRVRVGDAKLTAVITADAVRALKLRRGEDVVAIIKSTEVMIGRTRKPEDAALAPTRRIGSRRTKRMRKSGRA